MKGGNFQHLDYRLLSTYQIHCLNQKTVNRATFLRPQTVSPQKNLTFSETATPLLSTAKQSPWLCLEWLQGHVAFQEHPWKCSRFDPNQPDPQSSIDSWARNGNSKSCCEWCCCKIQIYVSLTIVFGVLICTRDSWKKRVPTFKFYHTVLSSKSKVAMKNPSWKYGSRCISNWKR